MAEVLSVTNWCYDYSSTNGVAGGWKVYSYGSGPSLADISLTYPYYPYGANFGDRVTEIGLANLEGVLSVDWAASATATANLNVQTTGPVTTITGLGARVTRRLGTGCSLLDGGQVALTGEFLNVSALVGAETPVFPLPAHIDYMGESYWFDDISLEVSCPPDCSVWLDPVSATDAAQLLGADSAGTVWVLSESVAFLTAIPSEWAYAQVTDSGGWDIEAVATRQGLLLTKPVIEGSVSSNAATSIGIITDIPAAGALVITSNSQGTALTEIDVAGTVSVSSNAVVIPTTAITVIGDSKIENSVEVHPVTTISIAGRAEVGSNIRILLPAELHERVISSCISIGTIFTQILVSGSCYSISNFKGGVTSTLRGKSLLSKKGSISVSLGNFNSSVKTLTSFIR